MNIEMVHTQLRLRVHSCLGFCHKTQRVVMVPLKCKVKPQGGGLLKIRGQDEAIAESGPTFWECAPAMGFTYCKKRGKIYHEPYLCRSQQAYEWEGSYAYSSIVGGFLHSQIDLISLPSLRSRHNHSTFTISAQIKLFFVLSVLKFYFINYAEVLIKSKKNADLHGQQLKLRQSRHTRLFHSTDKTVYYFV